MNVLELLKLVSPLGELILQFLLLDIPLCEKRPEVPGREGDKSWYKSSAGHLEGLGNTSEDIITTFRNQ